MLKAKTESRGKKSSLNGLIKRNISGWVLLIPSLILFIYIVWRPIVIGAYDSLFRLKGYTITEFVGLQNYADVLTSTDFPQVLGNTFQYVLWSLVIGFPLPFLVALMLNEMLHAKGFFKFTMYFPAVIPGIAVSLIWYFIYEPSQGGLLNMLLYFFGQQPLDWLQNKNLTIPLIVISMSWNGFGSTMIIYLASLQSVNQELYEAARLDGAGIFNRIRYVLCPHMYPILLLMLIRQVISVFQVMEQPLAMTDGGPNNASVTMALQSYKYAFMSGRVDWSLALSMVTFVILMVLTVIYFNVDKKLSD